MLVQITEQNKEEILTVTSRDVAEDFGKEHAEVIYSIEGRKDRIGIIPVLLKSNFDASKYFIESTYKDSMNRSKKDI